MCWRQEFTEIVRDDLQARPDFEDTADWVGFLADACVDLVVASLTACSLPTGRFRMVVKQLLGENPGPVRAMFVPDIACRLMADVWDVALDLACLALARGESGFLVDVVTQALDRCVVVVDHTLESLGDFCPTAVRGGPRESVNGRTLTGVEDDLCPSGAPHGDSHYRPQQRSLRHAPPSP